MNIILYENKSGHYCNLGNDWSHWTLTGKKDGGMSKTVFV
jgi:hypothetical protein